MTVQELITKLSGYPAELQVAIAVDTKIVDTNSEVVEDTARNVNQDYINNIVTISN